MANEEFIAKPGEKVDYVIVGYNPIERRIPLFYTGKYLFTAKGTCPELTMTYSEAMKIPYKEECEKLCEKINKDFMINDKVYTYDFKVEEHMYFSNNKELEKPHCDHPSLMIETHSERGRESLVLYRCRKCTQPINIAQNFSLNCQHDYVQITNHEAQTGTIYPDVYKCTKCSHRIITESYYHKQLKTNKNDNKS